MVKILILRDHYEAMLRHIQNELPNEACGLLAGVEGRSTFVYTVHNELQSPVRFQMDAREQVKALVELEDRGWELIAIFHSHPTGPPWPSQTDVAEFYYPGVLVIIWSPMGGDWHCRAFTIDQGQVQENVFEILE